MTSLRKFWRKMRKSRSREEEELLGRSLIIWPQTPIAFDRLETKSFLALSSIIVEKKKIESRRWE